MEAHFIRIEGKNDLSSAYTNPKSALKKNGKRGRNKKSKDNGKNEIRKGFRQQMNMRTKSYHIAIRIGKKTNINIF